eukprot:scaffold3290_cov165-Ochromonas_danica.AAC.70
MSAVGHVASWTSPQDNPDCTMVLRQLQCQRKACSDKIAQGSLTYHSNRSQMSSDSELDIGHSDTTVERVWQAVMTNNEIVHSFATKYLSKSSQPTRVAVPSNRQNSGFDILVDRCTDKWKRVLPIQCKDQEVNSDENGDAILRRIPAGIQSCVGRLRSVEKKDD